MIIVFEAAQECGILSEDEATVTLKRMEMTKPGVIEVVRFQPVYAFNLQAIMCDTPTPLALSDDFINEYRFV
jgi:hypothetical protein